MSVTVRPAHSGDGAGIARAWLSAATYHANFDPDHFQLPRAEGLAEGWDDQLGQDNQDLLQLVAELDGRVVGWLAARIEAPEENAAVQLTRKHAWTRLVVDALIVDRAYWRQGAGRALLAAAEAWGRDRGPRSPAWIPTRTVRSRCPSTKIAWAISDARSSSRSRRDHLIRRSVQHVRSVLRNPESAGQGLSGV